MNDLSDYEWERAEALAQKQNNVAFLRITCDTLTRETLITSTTTLNSRSKE